MKTNVLKIGITGGIGSGKSYVCRIFESLGYRIYYADARAKLLMHEDKILVEQVKTLLGKDAYTETGELNRAHVGSIVFNNPEKLQALNGFVHPAVGRDFFHWYRSISADYSKDFVLKEAAILYESGSYKEADGVISIYAPKQLRIKRVLEREPTTREAILARMAQQWPESEKMKRADYTIINDGEHLLLPQVREVINLFRPKK